MDQSFKPERTSATLSARPASMSMRKLLRSRISRAFLTSKDTWTQDIRQAVPLRDFASVSAASERLPAEDLEIYYSFNEAGGSVWDFTFSLRSPAKA